MKPVKIAMLSLTHGHTRKYYQVLRDNAKLDWVAVYAEDKVAEENFRMYEQSVPCYLDLNEMFEKHPDIEAVVLASANNLHLEQVKECAKRGVNILMMKVPTFDMAEYDEMIKVIDESKIVCQVELELHYNPVIVRLKELIASGRLGKIQSIQATNITLSPIWAFPWQGSPEASYGKREAIAPNDHRFKGGALCDHPHVFDLVRHLTNSDFDFVYSEVAPNIRPDIEVEDMLLVNGKMKNGIIFSFDPSWSRMEERIKFPGPGWEVSPKRMEVNITVIGDKGSVACDCFGPNVYHNGGPNDRLTVQYTYFDEWVGLIDEFVECIREGKEPMINLRWHRQTIESMNACYKSMANKQIIKL